MNPQKSGYSHLFIMTQKICVKLKALGSQHTDLFDLTGVS